MSKPNVIFLNSVKDDLFLFKVAPKYMRFDTGEDDYSNFLGYLRNEIEQRIEGLNEDGKEKVITEILEREHKKHNSILSQNLKSIKAKWADIEPKFFEKCHKIFDGNPFPQGEYTAIESIWGRYPCVIEEKKFSFPANTKLMMLVVIHELLHFAFYDFQEKHLKGKLSEDEAWQISEILNTLIMNREPFLSWAGDKSHIYPALQNKYEKLDKVYDARKSLKAFVEESISTLKD